LPEGAEVRRIAEQVAARVTNKVLQDVKVLSGRYQRHGPPKGFESLQEWTPIRFLGAGVHGKFMYLLLDAEWSIWCSLGMTGSWGQEVVKHSRVEFKLEDGSIYFSDPRNFGTLRFVKGKDPLIKKIKSLGPDVLAEELDDDIFRMRLMMRESLPVGEAILDQKVLAGVGNYLRAEALYSARISPFRLCSDLTTDECSRLNTSINSTIRESYKTGGATLRDYVDFNGDRGKFADRFAVYGNKTDPKGRDVKRDKLSGRTIHWVPEVQI